MLIYTYVQNFINVRLVKTRTLPKYSPKLHECHRYDIFYCFSVVTLDTTVDALHATDARTLTLEVEAERRASTTQKFSALDGSNGNKHARVRTLLKDSTCVILLKSCGIICHTARVTVIIHYLFLECR